ncbi:hypothetical protein EV186_111144 [Labedaea rhizosphaerae]|jgi:hypothetical protein|uniref:Uncharacterized protein n=1 Tax=Labedaea rhizosphaerae TaxID=598644 RepID=A0A4V3CXF1_LABRH|nr:hypothetical protein EV186_111144 [Labedaea rhizosphaerae]
MANILELQAMSVAPVHPDGNCISWYSIAITRN